MYKHALPATIAGFILQLPTTRVRARTKMADYDNLLTSPASRFRRTCWKARSSRPALNAKAPPLERKTARLFPPCVRACVRRPATHSCARVNLSN